MPLLIAVAKGREQEGINGHIPEIARIRAIIAITRNRTDEGVEALRELLNDPNKYIRNETERSIKEAYKQHPAYPQKVDEEYTAILIPIATNPNHPRNISLIAEIFRTRTEEGVEGIKKLIENPALDIPIAETDSGIKAIRDNLRSSDKNFRKMTSEIIKNVIKIYSNQPFRNDDFPDELKEDPIARKQKIIEMIQSWQN
jgi:hypothetical protein